MSALERSLAENFPNIIELPSGLKLEATLTPPSPVTELDEERGATALSGKRLAVCLHPWARLGGNMNDPCVSSATFFFNGLPLKRHPTRELGKQGTQRASAPTYSLSQILCSVLQRARRWALFGLEIVHGATGGRGPA
jgi:hypothetical protein